MPLQQFERAPSPSKAQFNEQATMLSNTQKSMTYVVDGKRCANSIPIGAYFQLINSTVSGRSDGAYTAKKAIPANTDIDNTYFTETAPITGGAVNSAFQALNSNLTKYAQIKAYNTGNNATQILTDIATNTGFGAVGVILLSTGGVQIVTFGKRFSGAVFQSTHTQITESNGYVLFNPGENSARLFVFLNTASQVTP